LFHSEPYYNATIRKIAVAFGTMFDDIKIQKFNSSGTVDKIIKVPLSYTTKGRWMSWRNSISAYDNDNKMRTIGEYLPKMAYEMSAPIFDPERKTNNLNKHRNLTTDASGNTVSKSSYQRIPYNIDFTLYIATKQLDDALQILEQILPYFNPDVTVAIKDNEDLEINTTIPFVLNDVSQDIQYEGGPDVGIRSIEYTLTFTSKFYLYGPVNTDYPIETVFINMFDTSTPGSISISEIFDDLDSRPTFEDEDHLVHIVQEFQTVEFSGVTSGDSSGDTWSLGEILFTGDSITSNSKLATIVEIDSDTSLRLVTLDSFTSGDVLTGNASDSYGQVSFFDDGLTITENYNE
jgi:hypothetical protein